MSSLLEDLTDWEEVSPGTTLDLRLEREEDASTDITDEVCGELAFSFSFSTLFLYTGARKEY